MVGWREGSTALQALRDVARVRPGDRVLVHGASGGVGALAIQLAKTAGAHVTATSGAARVARCAALGADEALDHASGEALAQGLEPAVLVSPRRAATPVSR